MSACSTGRCSKRALAAHDFVQLTQRIGRYTGGIRTQTWTSAIVGLRRRRRLAVSPRQGHAGKGRRNARHSQRRAAGRPSRQPRARRTTGPRAKDRARSAARAHGPRPWRDCGCAPVCAKPTGPKSRSAASASLHFLRGLANRIDTRRRRCAGRAGAYPQPAGEPLDDALQRDRQRRRSAPFRARTGALPRPVCRRRRQGRPSVAPGRAFPVSRR